ncbi:DUF2490 domain-containing protein [Pelagicoccus enzymogenes]|uniref:DUF2490 domain-containing protein n=1 Tax=Pelagicoccus enzymogenes TaxID=2773457 RepID=UPI00280CA5CA|nr:DUF2490 domain-containing protein [Pelagicoccus enzymogenes]MDQ8200118.1 DUF2490 domain-containing protein [Pelagicoccus enzymogenes]
MRNALILLTAVCLLPLAAYSDDGLDLWLTVNGPAQEIWENTKTKTQVAVRFPEFDELSYFFVSQKFTTKLNEKWSLGTHPVFETAKKGDEWSNTYRLDLELNPSKFRLGQNGPTISMRNRWELRWKEGKGSDIFHRIRHSTKATWKIDHGPFTAFSIGDEVFFEEDKGKITRNRFYPVMLDSKLGKHKINYYLLYQSDRAGTSDNWNGRYIAGSSLSF